MMAEQRSDSVDSPELYVVSDLTKQCILHASIALSPAGIKLPGSGTHRIDQFCTDILTFVHSYKITKKKKKIHLPEQSLVPEIEILNFYEGASTSKDFAEVVCEELSHRIGKGFNEFSVQKLCWELYFECQKSCLTYPKWLTPDSTFNLFQIFCSLLPSLSEFLELDTVHEVLERVFKLSGYTWSETFELDQSREVDFPVFVECLTKCFSSIDLHPSVVTEIVGDLKDEIVFGVLRKGYLIKKGHRVTNFKRRWFVLQRNVLRYYKSRDDLVEKGEIVLNSTTKTEVLPDRGDKKHRFLVICGKSGKEFEICADDNRARNEWLLDIGKAIQLEKALQQENEVDFTQSISHFYQLKYGTSSPNLSRLDSAVKRAKASCSPNIQNRLHSIAGTSPKISRIANHRFSGFEGGTCRTYTVGTGTAMIGSNFEQGTPEEVYEDMSGGDGPAEEDLEIREDDENDEEGYTFMFRGKGVKGDQEVENDVSNEEEADCENENPETDTGVKLEDLNYSECDISPRHAMHYFPKEPEKGSSKAVASKSMSDPCKSPNSPTNESNEQHYLQLTDKELLAIEKSSSLDNKQTKQAIDRKSLSLDIKQTKAPVPPPRPLETITQSLVALPSNFQDQSHDVLLASLPATPMSDNFEKSWSPPPFTTSLSSGQLSTVAPIPPPRPKETLASSTRSPSKACNPLHKYATSLEFVVEPEEGNKRNSLTPPPIPSRDAAIKKPAERKDSNGSYGTISSGEMRYPPYSTENNRTSESELYYVIPNAPSLK